jgi:chromate reductase, NAD(P)H dehydrogenase (quinone)
MAVQNELTMITRKIKILAISGSLRPMSSAGAIIRTITDLVPDFVDYKICGGLEDIPAFDDSKKLPITVENFIQQIANADAVLFCIPEYAFGVPGALKNALDWTVSSTVFSEKPVALITAASQGEKAHASMSLTLGALGARISEDTKLLISFIKTKLDEKGEVADPDVPTLINRVIQALLQTVESGIVPSQ